MFNFLLSVNYKVAAFLLAVLYSIGLPVQVRGKPLDGSIAVTAHSGCMDLPANSIEAMEAGINAGADIVEFDLNYTSDGTPVLFHNTPEDGATYVTLAEAFAFLAEHPGILANVDVKSTEYLEKVPVLAEEAGVTDQIFFTGVNEQMVATVREKCPGIPYYLNASVSKDDDVKALAEKTEELGAVGINLDWTCVSPELIAAFHKKGMPVSVWTVNEAADIIQMALAGADGITTRRPNTACDVIRQASATGSGC